MRIECAMLNIGGILNSKESDEMGRTILNYNFKGGVGKTTITGMEGYILAGEHQKTLLIDFDPQANLTSMIAKTYHKKLAPTISLTTALQNGDLSESICKANDYLDIVPTSWDLIHWSSRAERVGSPNRYRILNYLLKPLKPKYKYILIDVPPTFAPYSLNAIFAADDIAIVLETQESAYTSALKTVKTLGDLREKYSIKFHFLGVILYLMINAKVDRQVAHKSIDTFKEFLFKNPVKRQERVKGFSMNGISDKTYWDKRAIGMYKCLTDETQKRVKELNNND